MFDDLIEEFHDIIENGTVAQLMEWYSETTPTQRRSIAENNYELFAILEALISEEE